MDIKELKKKAIQIRKDVLTLIYNAKTGHTGGALSSTDIMTCLYYHVMNIDVKNPKNPLRDRFILSKGHTVEPLWAILADLGFYSKDELKTFCSFNTRLIGHPNNKVPGIEVNTGSLGHGLSVANGIALAGKKDQLNYRTFVLMGDGEQAEGSIWEGAMFASHYKLDNLVGIIDRNKLQISGQTENVMGLEPLADKWKAFGWNVIEINGNVMEELVHAFSKDVICKNHPTLIIAHTIKSKGLLCAENNPLWHHKVPNDTQYQQAIHDLDLMLGSV